MERIKLFEIPIYYTNSNIFNKKWDKERTRIITKLLYSGHSQSDAENFFKEISGDKRFWEYNQIIGYLVISIQDNDVNISLFMSKKQKIIFNKKSKVYIKAYPDRESHFYVSTRTTDIDIKARILEHIEEHKKTIKDIHKNYYLDMTIFNNLIEHINIQQMIS